MVGLLLGLVTYDELYDDGEFATSIFIWTLCLGTGFGVMLYAVTLTAARFWRRR
jgi:hypothetical protein